MAIDQFAGATAATEHLLRARPPTVWHIGGPPDWIEAEQRADGWRAALEAAGAPVMPVLQRGLEPALGLRDRAGRLAGDPDVTAIFVANDQMALGVLRALHEGGHSVPDRLSLVGFDDIPEAQYFTPPLTTVRQDFIEMGRRSLRMLLELVESGERPQAERRTVEPELIVRSSTAPPGA